jgi:hypothetical protein
LPPGPIAKLGAASVSPRSGIRVTYVTRSVVMLPMTAIRPSAVLHS